MSIPQKTSVPERRPGPFGPAYALLPKDQVLLTLPDTTIASQAIERMADEKYSQIPITNSEDLIVGAFTWRSFAKRVFDLRKLANLDALDLPIRDLSEEVKFVAPDVYIDTETDWGDIDYVVVGDAREPLGILCVADVFGRLNDFAEAFVLLYEIENEIRDLIRDIYDPDQLLERLDQLNVSLSGNADQIVQDLQAHIKSLEERPAVLGKALQVVKSSASRSLCKLEDFSFSNYTTLICSKRNWNDFDPVFERTRELVEIDFARVNELRNTVFHFRRQIKVSDTDLLRRFRNRLRDDREKWLHRSRKN